MSMKLDGNLEVADEQIEEFCKRWKVTELALFGSVVREDFGPDSDVDVLLSFEEGAPWSLWDIPNMQDELQRIFGRRVDIAGRRAVERSRNPFRRRSILNNARVVYEAR
jgi:hypothetical protein